MYSLHLIQSEFRSARKERDEKKRAAAQEKAHEKAKAAAKTLAARAVAKLAPLEPRLRAAVNDPRNDKIPSAVKAALASAASNVHSMHVESLDVLAGKTSFLSFDLATLGHEATRAGSSLAAWEPMVNAQF